MGEITEFQYKIKAASAIDAYNILVEKNEKSGDIKDIAATVRYYDITDSYIKRGTDIKKFIKDQLDIPDPNYCFIVCVKPPVIYTPKYKVTKSPGNIVKGQKWKLMYSVFVNKTQISYETSLIEAKKGLRKMLKTIPGEGFIVKGKVYCKDDTILDTVIVMRSKNIAKNKLGEYVLFGSVEQQS